MGNGTACVLRVVSCRVFQTLFKHRRWPSGPHAEDNNIAKAKKIF